MAKLRTRSLEFNLTEHCNLSCAGCDHASPLLSPRFASLASFERDFFALAQVLRVDELKLLGGEPLLHERLIDFARAARACGVGRRVALVTNGVLLHRLDEGVLDWIDTLRVSLYPGVRVRVDLGRLRRAARARGVKLEVERVNGFRRTLLDECSDNREAIRATFASCKLAHRWSCHVVHEGRYYKCSPAPFLEPRLATVGLRVENRAEDGLALHGSADLRADLERYLQDTTPLVACGYCMGTGGDTIAHRQLDHAERATGRDREQRAPQRPSRLRRRADYAVGPESPEAGS